MSKDPKELLARWASDEILDPFGPVPQHNTESAADVTPHEIPPITDDKQITVPQLAKGSPINDSALPSDWPEIGVDSVSESVVDDGSSITEPAPEYVVSEDSADAVVKIPAEFEQPLEEQPVRQASEELSRPKSFESSASIKTKGGGSLLMIGQILSYIGVLSLTIGTTFVLWGYFGENHPNYAPMGWLVLTAGQMLLFLGVVTLVSGGMEQTTAEVAQRIDALGEHIFRIEQGSTRRFSTEQPTAISTRPDLTSYTDVPPEAAA